MFQNFLFTNLFWKFSRISFKNLPRFPGFFLKNYFEQSSWVFVQASTMDALKNSTSNCVCVISEKKKFDKIPGAISQTSQTQKLFRNKNPCRSFCILNPWMNFSTNSWCKPWINFRRNLRRILNNFWNKSMMELFSYWKSWKKNPRLSNNRRYSWRNPWKKFRRNLSRSS